MNKTDYYKNLDPAEIKRTVSNWAESCPTIKKIFLSHSKHRSNKYVIMAETYDSRDLEIIIEFFDKMENFQRFFKHSRWFLEFYERARVNHAYDTDDPQWFVRFKKDFINYAQERFLNDWPSSSDAQGLKSDLNKACRTNKINLYPSWSFYSKIPEQEFPEEIFQDSLELIYERKNEPIPNLSAKKSHGHENKKTILPCPPGTKWKDVKITLIENKVVRIETPQGKVRFSYHELSMSDGRTGDKRPTMLWELLKLFAKNQGFIFSKNPAYDPKLPDTAKRLNKHLQEIFEIDESIYTDHYKSQKGYKTKIFFSDQTLIT